MCVLQMHLNQSSTYLKDLRVFFYTETENDIDKIHNSLDKQTKRNAQSKIQLWHPA